MKRSTKILSAIFALSLSLGMLTACDTEETATSSSSNNDTSTSSSSVVEPPETVNPPETNGMPTAAQIISARENATTATIQNYDFTLNLSGTIGALGTSGTVEANYAGQYRHNQSTGDLRFKKVTSGALLFDSTEYVYTENQQKVKMVMKDESKVKKVEILSQEEEEVTLINKPIIALIDSLNEENLSTVSESATVGYDYKVGMTFSSNNVALAKICSLVGGMGTSISLKGVTFTNPVSGMTLLFNLSEDNLLEDFKVTASIDIPFGESTLPLTLTYEQKGASSAISIPQATGIYTGNTDISRELNTVQSALTALKSEDDYSLDLLAENEFDPAWNKFAIVDKYTGRLYKNTVDENVWFNHSYKYNAHSEEDGAEAYEYAIGNLQNGKVYLASYKGDNSYTEQSGVTVDTQFDYMIAPVLQASANIDCVKVETEGSNTKYSFYLNKNGTLSVQNTILNMINSNEADGVVDVNNYFNSENMIKKAEIVVEFVNGKISTIQCLTELKYTPTGGEYTEYNITLTNKIELKINDKLSAAEKYESPTKTNGLFDNLESIL